MKTFRIAALVSIIAASVLSSAQHGAPKPPDSAIDQIMQARSAAARQGHILYERAFGLANLEWQIPNDLQTKFEIGSMTKQFTALLILQFVNEGRVHLDGHISDYLPYYRSEIGNRVTVTELLSQTSGIPNFLSTPGVPTAESRLAAGSRTQTLEGSDSPSMSPTFHSLPSTRSSVQ